MAPYSQLKYWIQTDMIYLDCYKREQSSPLVAELNSQNPDRTNRPLYDEPWMWDKDNVI